MDKNIEDKISSYLNGELSETDRMDFEREIAADADLARRIETSKLQNAAFDMLSKNAKDKMNTWHADLPVTEKIPFKVVWYKRRIFLAAASIALLVSVWVGYNINQSSNEKIVAEFAAIPPTLKDDNAGALPENSTETDFSKAKKDFEAKNYDEAARLFKSQLDATTNPSAHNTRRNLQINLAHCFFKLKRYGEAAVLYQSAQREGEGLQPLSVTELAQIRHFEVLSLIGNNQIDDAKKRMDLMDPSNKALDARLNSFWRF